MPSSSPATVDLRAGFAEDGFCLLRGVVPLECIALAREASSAAVARQPAEHFAEQRSTGTMIPVSEIPGLAGLVAWPGAAAALAALGWRDCVFTGGYVISKPPGAPRLFWHQDWCMWDEPRSYTDLPSSVFLMYYLVDTTRANGCLRVIPGSHRRRHPLHDVEAHTDTVRSIADPSSPVHGDVAGEIDVPVRAGDLVIGDSRLLHASHANRSDAWRTVLTFWFFPEFHAFSPAMRCFLADQRRQYDGWPSAARACLEPVLPPDEGLTVARIPWNRFPGPAFR
jgi:hypothetical protein